MLITLEVTSKKVVQNYFKLESIGDLLISLNHFPIAFTRLPSSIDSASDSKARGPRSSQILSFVLPLIQEG